MSGAPENVPERAVMDGQGDHGEALKLFQFDSEGHLQLNAANLDRILNATSGLPVQVLSVAGAFRGGKSFLLNIIMLYLQRNGKHGWFEDPNAEIKGFPSKKSWDTVTTGIDAWSKPFVMKNGRGESIAFILLDTQGTNDTSISKGQFTRIFALSTLLSDIQVNNIRNTIGSDQLEQLHYFLEFAKYVVASDSTQKRLVMLVRDWQLSNNFGFAEGTKYWTEQVMRPSSSSENAELKKSLHGFMEVKCFVLPSPGDKMLQQQEFRGPTSDLKTEFQEYVVQLVTELFSGNQAEGKSSKELHFWCFKLAEVFKSQDLPEPKSLIGMEAERMCVKAVDDGLALFESKLEEKINATSKRCTSHDELERICEEAKSASLALYDKERKGFEVQEIRKAQRERLTELIEARLKYLLCRNDERVVALNHEICEDILAQFEEKMTSTTNTVMEESEFITTSDEYIKLTLQEFISRGIDAKSELSDLTKRLQEKTRIFETQNHKKLNDGHLNQAIQYYTTAVTELCRNPMDEVQFQRESRAILQESCSNFEKNVTGSQELREYYCNKLRVLLLEKGKMHQDQNQRLLSAMMKFEHQHENETLKHEKELERISMQRELNEVQCRAELEKAHLKFEHEKEQQRLKDKEELNRIRTEIERESEKKLHEIEQKMMREEREKADKEMKALQQQLDAQQEQRENREREHEAKLLAMRQEHEAEIKRLKEKKKSYGWWDKVLQVVGTIGGSLGGVAGPILSAITSFSK